MNKKIIFAIVGLVILGGGFGLIFSSGTKEQPKEESSVSFKKIDKMLEKNKYNQAKKTLEEKKNSMADPSVIKKIQDKIQDINIQLLFSPNKETKCSTIYTVKRGDALAKIAKKFNTTVDLIKKSNNLDSDKIIPGQELKVNTCKFSIVVDKSQNLLLLKRDGKIFKTYLVATGKNGRTPEGDFKIINKLVKPTWYKTGAVVLPDNPDNILGSRWMGIDKQGYGIHGTTKPESLGQQVTLGCIRMSNKEVEEIYDIVPVGTEVVIVE
ncbi:MAG: L,D-transpeptidase family protein [Candidatus Omnitrophica bacterium]|nr:L,D-transpeptidase family protein [Candidatus Omnitrophota bacterium]MCF7878880.1 L,D-transpeptidase family protein [Candidatus Omnitrophota bacterium]MCF7893719.1 L,D-transpeptidase family protein [Candidatus Omnitrophota bacterium]